MNYNSIISENYRKVVETIAQLPLTGILITIKVVSEIFVYHAYAHTGWQVAKFNLQRLICTYCFFESYLALNFKVSHH